MIKKTSKICLEIERNGIKKINKRVFLIFEFKIIIGKVKDNGIKKVHFLSIRIIFSFIIISFS
jgi:hypothetical protein